MIEIQPVPEKSGGAEAPFWEALDQGHLVIQFCAACDKWMFPTRIRCGGCGTAPEWRPVSGRGHIWSYTRVHAPVLPAFAPYTPYPVAVVELVEPAGIRLVGNIVERADSPINAVPMERIAIGAPVEMVVRDLNGTPWPGWRLT